jgi:tRNA(Ile2) C34 agmatinyltransferase TiaS
MSAFVDGRCAKCGKRMGWTGRSVDKPRCPKCLHTPDEKERAELAAADAEMDEFRKLLTAKEGE